MSPAAKHPPILSDETPPDPQAHGLFAALRRALPAGEVIRFLAVGASNTLIALVLYSACVILYGHLLPHRGKPFIADLSSITSKPIAITVAFLCYKHLVFRTKGNYLKEWMRCFAVYGAYIPVELVILPIATHIFQYFVLTNRSAPFLAGIVNSCLTAAYSYFGHKKFSFRR